MPAHPGAEDREWVLAGLAEIVSRTGWERFVLAPLIEPNDRSFPDAYEHGPRGVRVVAQRLLRHAGLDGVIARVHDERPDDDGNAHALLPRTELSASLEGDVLHVTIEDLGPAEDVVPVLAHWVGCAFRERHGLDRPLRASSYREPHEHVAPEDEDLAVQLGTLASIHLGFGILAANAAQRYRAAGRLLGRDAETQWIHDHVGGLEATTVCFALAVQLVVRGTSEADVARACAWLAPNQSADVRAWIRALESERDALRERLGAPTAALAATPWSLDLAPLADPEEDEEDDDIVVAPRRPRRPPNEGRRVFRVKGDLATPYGVRGVAAGAAVALAMTMAGLELAWIPLLVCAALGIGLGARVRRDRCSDPDCEQIVDPGDASCTGCGGTIAGEIARASQRLAAEEEIEERERAERRARR